VLGALPFDVSRPVVPPPVSIRCAELSADRSTALARAGGGIVAESGPDDEAMETTTKFATILNAPKVDQ
jgi:isochorismate synthase